MANADDDEHKLAAIATALADAVDAALPGWVERCVLDRAPLLSDAATEAGRRAATDVGAEVRALLATDVDEQRANPLAVLRSAVRYPTAVLAAAGVPPVVRSEFDERAFPDDVYGLAPATWADVDPDLHERGIVWGAAKAHVVLNRRKAEGEAMTITLLSTDLMDRSRFPVETVFVGFADQLAGDADVVVVDVMRPDVLDGVRRLRTEGSVADIVGYGRHDDPGRLAEAREAGCDRVLVRSEFFADVADAIAL